MKRQIISETKTASCYFRTSVDAPNRKALVQITEWCNLHCAHCFVSAGKFGDTMSFTDIENLLVPRLMACRVISVSLTGGEPFAHERIVDIASLLRKNNIKVSICTNGTFIKDGQMEALASLGEIHCNVSLDGFSPESHGKFRGDKDSFEKTVTTVRELAKHKLLQGLLVTPNNLAEVSEYAKLCEFAVENGATYVLMNPLSSMGRGVKSVGKLAMPNDLMREIEASTAEFSDRVQLVKIRFPNDKKLPLASCEAGNIVYVFTRGELTVCPYLVFAANTPQSLHKAEEFIVGNIFKDEDIADRLDAYKFGERYKIGGNPTCGSCQINAQCGKGCPAAVITSGKKIEEVDTEVCPMADN